MKHWNRGNPIVGNFKSELMVWVPSITNLIFRTQTVSISERRQNLLITIN